MGRVFFVFIRQTKKSDSQHTNIRKNTTSKLNENLPTKDIKPNRTRKFKANEEVGLAAY